MRDDQSFSGAGAGIVLGAAGAAGAGAGADAAGPDWASVLPGEAAPAAASSPALRAASSAGRGRGNGVLATITRRAVRAEALLAGFGVCSGPPKALAP